MTDAPVSDAQAAPFGWSAKNPQGGTTLFKGAQPPTSLGYSAVVEIATSDDYHATEQALMASAAQVSSPIPTTISRRQFYQQLAIQSVITNDEALAALRTGTTPAALADLIAALPSDQQFGAEMMVLGAEFNRTDPLTLALGAAMHWTSDQIDALWVAAAGL